MSWLSNFVHSVQGTGGEDPEAVRQRQAAAAAAEQQQTQQTDTAAEAQRQATIAEQTRQAQIQSALASFGSTFPTGFDKTYAPDTLVNPALENTLSTQRGGANDFINAMLKRQTLTQSGGTKAMDVLKSREPGARSKLTDIGNLLLEQERGKLRGIGSEAYSAAQQGGGFDVSPYVGRVQKDVSDFTAGLPQEFTSRAPTDLFDTASLAGASGAVTDSANVQYDPYAQEGGKLSAGLSDTSSPPPSTNKRRTSIF